MVDYVKLAKTAKRLVEANGRAITLIRRSVIAADTAKPWEGPDSTETSLPLFGVFVPPNTVRQFGLTALGEGTEFQDLVAFSEQVIITYPKTSDLKQYRTVRDGLTDWGIIGLQVLKPGPTLLLAFIGVRR